MQLRALVAVLVALALVATACGDSDGDGGASTSTQAASSEPTPTLRTIDLEVEGRSIVVEVADEPDERTQGLSDRDALPHDGGMLFVWDQPAVYTLWMKSMRFPLDFVWIDEERRVVRVNSDVPEQPDATDVELVRYDSGAPVLYALELNAGAAARFGINAGDVLTFDESE